MWKLVRDPQLRNCSHTTLHSSCTELSRPCCCQLPPAERTKGRCQLSGSVKLLLLPGKAKDSGAWVQSLFVCAPSVTGTQSQDGIAVASRLGAQPVRPKSSSILSTMWKERGWEQYARQPWPQCVLTLQSALKPGGTGAQDLLKGMNSVISFRVLL